MPPPAQIVTFLFTDIERSSVLWEMHPQAMGRALAQHDALMRAVFEEHHGHIFKTMGDAFCVAFDGALDAVHAAVTAQRQLSAAIWEETGPLRVRMALHSGEAERRDGDYFGPTLNRVARVLSTGHGGQTLLSRSTAEAVRLLLPSEMSLRDLGERRLKDLSRPERIFQFVVADLPAEFPPLRSLEVLPNNLPAQVTSFIGRAREMAEVKRLLGVTRLLTLTGPGGSGKTRLSLQVSAEVLELFPHGVWLVELATVTEPARVPEMLADALGIRLEGSRSPLETLIEALRNRHLLLVIDNCEHLIEACARLASSLLQRCAELRILASSREPLNIAGETLWSVPALGMPDTSQLGSELEFTDLEALESVQLFVDRAAAVRPGFALTRENASLIAEICWRLDGIPLALELAAARIKVLPLAEILERLDDRFRLLTGGSRTAMPRQQTLGALIEWSYDLLTEAERTLLRRLVVFVAGRTQEMAEEVCSGEGLDRRAIFDLLSSLTDKSLLMVEPGTDGRPRYTMLESIWSFAEERLAPQEEEWIRRRHLEYFVRLAEEAEPRLCAADQQAWLERLGIEHLNLNQALHTSITIPGATDLGLRLAGALVRYWEVRNYFVEGYEHCLSLLSAPKDHAGDPLIRAKAMVGAGRLAWCQDRDEAARGHFLESRAVYASLNREAEVALIEAYLGFIERNEGHPEESRAHFDRAEALAGQLGLEPVRAMVLSGRGSLAGDEGDFVVARQWKEASLEIFRRLGDHWIVGLVVVGLGRVCVGQNDLPPARLYLREALTIARELGNKLAIPYVLEVMGDLVELEGRATKAIRLYGAASAHREALALSFSWVERQAYDQALIRLRNQVPAAEFQEEWNAGRALSLTAAVRLAME